MGLPNQGIDYYLITCLPFKSLIPKGLFFLSLVGMSPDETHMLLKKKCKTVDSTALPNSIFPAQTSPASRKSPMILKPPSGILSEAFAYFDKPLGIKLPPYFDIVHFDQAAEVFNRHPLKFVNCVNSIGNGMYIEDESVVIRPKKRLRRHRWSIHQTDCARQCPRVLSKTGAVYPSHWNRRRLQRP